MLTCCYRVAAARVVSVACFLAARGEEGLDHVAAIRSENTGSYLHAMVQVGVGENLKTGLYRATTRLRGSIDQSRHTRLNHGSGAHAARLNGHVQGGIRQAVVADYSRGFAQHNNFRMCRGITIANGAIAGARQYSSFMHQHRADRHFTAGGRFARLRQCVLHKFDVSVHVLSRITWTPVSP
jgi:hypothetical protein